VLGRRSNGTHLAAVLPVAGQSAANGAKAGVRRTSSLTKCTTAGQQSFVGGGTGNVAGGLESGIIAGESNDICDEDAFIGAGDDNAISGGNAAARAFIGAGVSNTISSSSQDSFIGAGDGNSVTGLRAAIVGGLTNQDSGEYAFVGAGESNSVSSQDAVINGGSGNTNSGADATIGGGQSNTITSAQGLGVIAGGGNNTNSASAAVISGGYGSSNSGQNGVIGGGQLNLINPSGQYATIGGGASNTATAQYAVISGGENNVNGGSAAVIGGGYGSTNQGQNGVIGGGQNNDITSAAQYALVGGGASNTASASYAAIAGGLNNSVSGEGGYIAAGGYNTLSGTGAVIDGGFNNAAAGAYGTVPGGYVNSAGGVYSFAAGARASAIQTGTFVWSDGSDGDTILKSLRAYQFLARASGGFTLWTNAASTVGATLAPGSGTWASASDRSMKTNVARVDETAVLEKIAGLPINTWSYITERGVRHVGPMAQDFYAAFGVGEDDKHITSIDEDGVALAAIKALHAENAQLRATTSSQSAQIAAMQRQLQRLNEKVDALER
jgi:hypothetical protein